MIDEQNNTTPEADLSLSKPALKPEANLEIPANKYPVSIADELAALPNLAEQTIVDFGKAAKEGKWTLPEAATQKTGLWASAGKGAITAIASLGEAVGAVGKEYAPEGFIKGHLEGMEYHWGNVAALNAPDSDLRDKSIMENPEIALSPRWWAHGVGQIVPSMALTIAGGGLGAGAASAAAGTGFRAGTSGILTRAVASGSTAKLRAAQKLGAQIGAGLTGGSMEGLHTASEVFDRGGSKLDAGVAFAGVTALSGALNAIGLDFILNPKTGQSAILGSMKAALGEGITEYLEEPTEAGVLILTDQFIDLENQFIEEGYGTLMTDALKRIDAGILSLPLGAFGGGVQVKRYAKAGKKDSTLKVKVSEEDGQADEVTGVEALEGVGGASEPLIAEPDTQTRAEEIELPSYEIGEGASTPAFNYKVTREAFLESGGNPVKQSARSRSYVKGVQKSLREKLNQPDLEISAPDILPEHGAFGAYTGALGLETIFVETGEGQRGFDEAFISQEKGQTPVLLVNVKSKDSLRAAGSHGIYHFVEKYFKSEGLEMENSLKKTLTKYLERGLRGDVKGIDASFFEDEKARIERDYGELSGDVDMEKTLPSEWAANFFGAAMSQQQFWADLIMEGQSDAVIKEAMRTLEAMGSDELKAVHADVAEINSDLGMVIGRAVELVKKIESDTSMIAKAANGEISDDELDNTTDPAIQAIENVMKMKPLTGGAHTGSKNLPQMEVQKGGDSTDLVSIGIPKGVDGEATRNLVNAHTNYEPSSKESGEAIAESLVNYAKRWTPQMMEDGTSTAEFMDGFTRMVEMLRQKDRAGGSTLVDGFKAGDKGQKLLAALAEQLLLGKEGSGDWQAVVSRKDMLEAGFSGEDFRFSLAPEAVSESEMSELVNAYKEYEEGGDTLFDVAQVLLDFESDTLSQAASEFMRSYSEDQNEGGGRYDPADWEGPFEDAILKVMDSTTPDIRFSLNSEGVDAAIEFREMIAQAQAEGTASSIPASQDVKTMQARMSGLLGVLRNYYAPGEKYNQFFKRMEKAIQFVSTVKEEGDGGGLAFNGYNAGEVLRKGLEAKIFKSKKGEMPRELDGVGKDTVQDIETLLSSVDPEQALADLVEQRDARMPEGKRVPIREPIAIETPGPYRGPATINDDFKMALDNFLPDKIRNHPKYGAVVERIGEGYKGFIPDPNQEPKLYDAHVRSMGKMVAKSVRMNGKEMSRAMEIAHSFQSIRYMYDAVSEYLANPNISSNARAGDRGARRANKQTDREISGIWNEMILPAVRNSGDKAALKKEVTRGAYMQTLMSVDSVINRAMVIFHRLHGTDGDATFKHKDPETGEMVEMTARDAVDKAKAAIQSRLDSYNQGQVGGNAVSRATNKALTHFGTKGMREVKADDFVELGVAIGDFLSDESATKVRMAQTLRFGEFWFNNKAAYQLAERQAQYIMSRMAVEGRKKATKEEQKILDTFETLELKKDRLLPYMGVEYKYYNELDGVDKDGNDKFKQVRLSEDEVVARKASGDEVLTGSTGQAVDIGTVLKAYDIYQKASTNSTREGMAALREHLGGKDPDTGEDISWGTRKGYWMTEKVTKWLEVEELTGMDFEQIKKESEKFNKGMQHAGVINSRTNEDVEFAEGNVMEALGKHVRMLNTRLNNFEPLTQLNKDLKDGVDKGNIHPKMVKKLQDHIKLMYGLPSDKQPHVVTEAVLKVNAAFWNMYPLSLSRAVWFNSRNIAFQGMAYGPMLQQFESEDVITTWPKIFGYVGKYALRGDKFNLDDEGIPRGLVMGLNVYNDDVSEARSIMHDYHTSQDVTHKGTPQELALLADIRMRMSEFAGKSLTWGDDKNRMIAYATSWTIGEKYVGEYVNGKIEAEEMFKRLKFDGLNSSQELHLQSQFAHAVKRHKDGEGPTAFDQYLHDFSSMKNENINYVYSSIGRTLVEQDPNVRPFTGVMTYPRATIERLWNQGFKQIMEGAQEIQAGGTLSDSGKVKTTEGLKVVGKHALGHWFATVVGAMILGEKDEWEGEDGETKETYGWLTSMSYQATSPGFSIAADIAGSSGDFFSALFSLDTEGMKKASGKLANRGLWFVPLMSDFRNIAEAAGNRQALSNLDMLEVAFTEMKLDEAGEARSEEDRQLISWYQNILYGNESPAAKLSLLEIMFKSLELPGKSLRDKED